MKKLAAERAPLRFHGRIAGVGSTSGVRVVVGRWHETPLGAFSDAMVETASGHRVLLAPTREVADFIAATYVFDEVRIEPVTTTGEQRWRLESVSLALSFDVGARTALGLAVHAVPRRVAVSPAWATALDPIARVVLRGVRTRGAAQAGRREWYAATDVHAIDAMRGRFEDVDLGQLARVDPPCHFGFSSTPRRPGVTDVVTTVSGS